MIGFLQNLPIQLLAEDSINRPVPLIWNAETHNYKTAFTLGVDLNIENLPYEKAWTARHIWGATYIDGPSDGEFHKTFYFFAPSQIEFTLTVTVHNSEAPDTTYIFKWLCTGFGGPLIAESFKTPDEAAFIYHRLGGTDTQTDQWTFPWFVYEFDYNPFNYRAAGSNQYHPDNIQTSSIVRFRRLWSQPPGVSCQGSVNGHGVILLQHPNMEIISGQENSKRTTWVDPNVWMPVGFDGSTGQGNEEFNFSFSYRFDLEPGVSVPSYAGDFSCDYWAYTWAQNPPNIPVADASKFLTFRSHRPTIAEDVAQPPVADPPLQGTNMMGNWYVYRVVDQNQMGLPGVWVQERFWLGVPDDALINAKPWTTQRQSFSDNEAISVEEFLDGYFDHPDALRIPIDDVPLTPEIDGHEYWAGTL